MLHYTNTEEEIYNKAIAVINNLPRKYIDISTASSIINVKRSTIKAKILNGEIPGILHKKKECKDCYHIEKECLFKLAKVNKPAIVGWKTQTELNNELKLKNRVVENILKTNKFYYELDLCKRFRLPQETVIKIKEILSEYSSKEVFIRDGITYYSLVKLSHDMAKNLHTRYNTGKFNDDKERIYKCLYKWLAENKIDCIKMRGTAKIYISEYVYNKFVSLIRISDAAKLMCCSRRSIYNWINKGLIEKSVIGENYSMISTKELDTFLVRRVQLKFGIEYPEQLEEISSFDSMFWKDKISTIKKMKTLFKDNKGDFLEKTHYDYIFKLKGWDKGVVDGIEKLAKFRTSSSLFDISLDEKIFDGEESKGGYFEDKSTRSQEESMLFKDLYHHIKDLPEYKRVLVTGYFGIDCDKLSMENLAIQTGLTVTEVDLELKGIFSELKDKLSL